MPPEIDKAAFNEAEPVTESDHSDSEFYEQIRLQARAAGTRAVSGPRRGGKRGAVLGGQRAGVATWTRAAWRPMSVARMMSRTRFRTATRSARGRCRSRLMSLLTCAGKLSRGVEWPSLIITVLAHLRRPPE